MGIRSAVVVFVCAVALLVVGTGAPPTANAFPGQFTASKSYYTVLPAESRIDARIEAEVQADATGDVETIALWAMPRAENIVVTRDDTELETEITPASDDTPVLVAVTLDRPLKGKLTAELVMTYTVPAQKSELVEVSTGVVESYFVSQGFGSFVFLDLPETGDNVVDPGCVQTSKQPGGGFTRWVCGEAAMVALQGNDPGVVERCANLDDRCRQRLSDLPFSAFAQSITDPSLISVLKETVDVAGKPVEMELKYFRSEAAWAQRQFDVAKQAFPLLHQVFGFEYPHDQALFRQSHQIGSLGIGGLAFTESGEMLLGYDTGLDEEITVHELAHQWAGMNLEHPWLWEGLAEYATGRVAPQLGIALYPTNWQEFGYTDPLATWYQGSEVTNPNYWYGKAGAFWFAYEAAIGGPETMAAVLGRLDDEGVTLPATGRWFMDAGEAASGANLDALFLEWVWQPDVGARTLEQRRTAHTLVAVLEADAATVGLAGVPTDLQFNLDAWTFGPVDRLVQRATAGVDDYRQLLAAETAAGVTGAASLASTWPQVTTETFIGSVADYHNVLRQLQSTAENVSQHPADSPSHGILASAWTAYSEGELADAKRLSSESEEIVFNVDASERMIAIAEKEQERYEETFIKRIGLMGKAPADQLAEAKTAYEGGDYAAALQKAESAYEAWNGAQARGFQLLAFAAALMCALSFAVWWFLRRIDLRSEAARKRDIHDAHHIERKDLTKRRDPRWKDWENTP